MSIYIIPEMDKPLKFVCEDDVKTEIDDAGNFVITRKLCSLESAKLLAELFDVSISDILSGKVKFGQYKED